MMTMNEVIEWAWAVGWYPEYINRQWILHDYDVWIQNPHYMGPPQRHPEDESDIYNYFWDGVPVEIYETRH